MQPATAPHPPGAATPTRPWLMALCFTALGFAALGFAAKGVQAQQVYRIIGADGKVSFSDRPPANTDAKTTGTSAVVSGARANPALPFELRDVVSRFPVTLYTGANCAPCSSARSLLVQRGVPFTERTVSSNQDVEALQKISGENNLPFATIGAQQLKGYADVEWNQYLDAAGYTTTSKLPSGYRNPEPTPLVASAKAPSATDAASAATAARQAARNTAPPPPPPVDPNANPTGIKF